MRRYIYIFGLTVLFWGTSCADFINIQPENATTYSNYYKNEKELEAVLTGLQVYLRQAVGEFTGGDISRAGYTVDVAYVPRRWYGSQHRCQRKHRG